MKNLLLSASQSPDVGRISFSFYRIGLIFLQKLTCHIAFANRLLAILPFGKQPFLSSGFITRPVSLTHVAPMD